MKQFSRSEPIVPGVSIAGICLDEDGSAVAAQLEEMGLKVSLGTFENVGRDFLEWTIEDWGVSFTEEPPGGICRISCSSRYQGRYKQAFYPGMPVREIAANSAKQLFTAGWLIIDGEFGLQFDVPEVYKGIAYDDFDTIEQLPDEMIIEYLHVVDRGWLI
ncbi:hypothetical protein [Haloferula sp. BvORR071]|uniref:hypothetical protein n=1 Tax=Haloferula sp. BvORR071 TaxID=1396141 RepID=UPI002240FF6E|nr:hypothetical protein [Haloferula sp. BvORR071]